MKRKVFLPLLIFTFILSIIKVNANEIKKEDVPIDTYIIGSHMLRHRNYITSENYDGKLTTKIIMLSSATIDSGDIKDMIIYYKNPLGDWKDGETGEQIDIPEIFNIDYVDLKGADDTEFINITKPDIGVGISYNYYDRSIVINNINEYCDGVCNGDGSDKFIVDGYEIYEKNGSDYVKIATNSNMYNYKLNILPNTNKTYAVRAFKNFGNDIVYSEYSNEVNDDLTIPTPDLAIAQDYDYYNRYINLNNYYDDYCLFECTHEEGDYTIIDGFEIYEKVNNEYRLVSLKENGNLRTEFGSYEYVNIMPEPYTRKNYAVRVFVNFDGQKIYSDYSNVEEVDATFETPKISFAPEIGGNVGYNAETNSMENWVRVNDLIDNYCFLNDNEHSGTCLNYTVDGFTLYEMVYDSYRPIKTIEAKDGAFHVSTIMGETKILYVRAFTYNSKGDPIYGDYSNGLVFEGEIERPIIDISYNGSGDINNISLAPLSFELVDNVPSFAVYLSGNYHVHLSCNQDNPGECEPLVDDYEWFEKNGDTLTSVYDGGFGGEATVYVPVGSKKTFVAKAYVRDKNNNKIYSDESNQIIVDLTNPVYTFETKELTDNSSKVDIRAYINDYEIYIHGIKINDTIYDTTYDTAIDKSVIDNVDNIILGLDQISESDPNSFVVEENASRITNSVWSRMDKSATSYKENVIGMYCYAGDSLIVPKTVGTKFTCNPGFELSTDDAITHLKFDINTGSGIKFTGFTKEDANSEIKINEITGNTHKITFNSSESYFEYAYRLNFEITDISNPNELYVEMNNIKFRTINDEYYTNPLKKVTIQ